MQWCTCGHSPLAHFWGKCLIVYCKCKRLTLSKQARPPAPPPAKTR